MLSRLKFSSEEISEDFVGNVLLDWSLPNVSPKKDDVRKIVEWYKNSEVFKKRVKSISVYRGLYFKNIELLGRLLLKNKLTLKDIGYSSWTVSPSQVVWFANGAWFTGGFGVVMSQKIKDNYFDVNKVYNYLRHKDIFTRAYTSECEIITSDPCKICSFNDIEFILINPSVFSKYLKSDMRIRSEWKYKGKKLLWNVILNFMKRKGSKNVFVFPKGGRIRDCIGYG